MHPSPFESQLQEILRDLEEALGPGGGTSELEETLRAALERARRLAIPRDAREVLSRVGRSLGKGLQGASRRRAIERALDRLRSLADPRYARAALARSPEQLPGVGPKTAAGLKQRGLATIEDLLFLLPARWDDRRALQQVESLQVGRRATLEGTIRTSGFVHRRGRFPRIFEALLEDDSGAVSLKWFRGGESIAKIATPGARVLVTGEVKRYRFSKELVHPEIERLSEGDSGLRRIVADYPTPEGLRPQTLRRAIARAVADHADLVSGSLPASLVRQRSLPEPAEALRRLHDPPPDADLAALRQGTSAAHERLVLEELYLLQLGLVLRLEGRRREPGIPIETRGPRLRAAPEALPFRLTAAQRRVCREILRDLAEPHPMGRLLQGDVGSGKTVVAFLAAVAAAESGYQTALMAPTELLAEQHHRSFERLSARLPAPLRQALLTSSRPAAEARRLREQLAAGEIDCVVGTHALVQRELRFARLALAVIDEQHRFGVLQRQTLSEKGADGRHPHVLVMTATPIPRTLALTLRGDLELSVIDELPPGRRPVETLLLREGEAAEALTLLRETVARGEQAYVVYPLVEESEKSDLRSATESAQRIQAALPGLAVDLVHGRQSAEERISAMGRFERGESAVLVSTTVIEVGVDVPGATLIIVEHAERFGLAQLHQLRGRVGRGSRPGRCVLIARGSTAESEARLTALLQTQDGFAIADADLRIRGPGELLGTRQHGRDLLDLRIAHLIRDAALVPVAREAALATVHTDPGLRAAPRLAQAVRARWGARLALADVG